MRKLIIVIAIFCSLSLVVAVMPADVKAANVELCITVPDAWVSATIAAVTEKWPMPVDWFAEEDEDGNFIAIVPEGTRVKRWTEHKLRAYLRNIVAPYKTKLDRQAALEAGGYVATGDTDIPIEISQ